MIADGFFLMGLGMCTVFLFLGALIYALKGIELMVRASEKVLPVLGGTTAAPAPGVKSTAAAATSEYAKNK